MRIIVDTERDGRYTVWMTDVIESVQQFMQYQYLTSAADDVYQRMSKITGGTRWYLAMNQDYVSVSTDVVEHDTVLFESADKAEIYHMLKAHLQMMRGEEP